MVGRVYWGLGRGGAKARGGNGGVRLEWGRIEGLAVMEGLGYDLLETWRGPSWRVWWRWGNYWLETK